MLVMKQNYLVLFLLIPLQVFAQKTNNNYECIYEYTVKTANAETETFTTILQFDAIHAKFVDYWKSHTNLTHAGKVF